MGKKINVKQKIREISETICREMGEANDTHYWIITIVDPRTAKHSTCSNLTNPEHLAQLLGYIISCMRSDETIIETRELELDGDN